MKTWIWILIAILIAAIIYAIYGYNKAKLAQIEADKMKSIVAGVSTKDYKSNLSTYLSTIFDGVTGILGSPGASAAASLIV